MLEYTGLVIVSAAVIVGVFVASGGYRLLPPTLADAICRIIGGDCGKDKELAPPGTPDIASCTVAANINDELHRKKAILYSEEDRTTSQVSVAPDGTITMSQSDADSSGLDLRGGFGVNVGGISVGVTIGGNYMWTGEDQQILQFEDREQVDEWNRRIEDEVAEFEDEYGDGPYFDPELMERRADIPRNLARDMGIPLTRIHADGEGFSGSLEAEVIGGIEEGGGRVSLAGTAEHFDEKGNPTTSEYYSVDTEFGITIGGHAGLEVVEGALSAGWERSGEYVTEIRYDADGNPTEMVYTETTSWQHESGRGVELSLEDPEGARDGSGEGGHGTTVSDGDVTVRTTTIPLEPSDAGLVREAFHSEDFGDRLAAAEDLHERLARRPPSSYTMQQYETRGDTSRSGVSASVVIELGAWEHITTTQSMDLEEAVYRDPTTGDILPWAECENAAD